MANILKVWEETNPKYKKGILIVVFFLPFFYLITMLFSVILQRPFTVRFLQKIGIIHIVALVVSYLWASLVQSFSKRLENPVIDLAAIILGVMLIIVLLI